MPHTSMILLQLADTAAAAATTTTSTTIIQDNLR